jgi:hypothetical protein
MAQRDYGSTEQRRKNVRAIKVLNGCRQINCFYAGVRDHFY